MKRKAEKQQAAPLSAIAARRARQQQAQNVTASKTPEPQVGGEPPSKKPRRSLEVQETTAADRTTQTRSASKPEAPVKISDGPSRGTRSQKPAVQPPAHVVDENEDEEPEEDGTTAIAEDDVPSTAGEPDGYESPADTPAELQNFPLSRGRLNKGNIVYSDDHTLCVRIKEKMNLALLGQYDLWVKRGVVSLMGAKLHPSSRLHRVYAPSTHSLPVIKCVSGVDGEAEVEIKSCHSGIARLRDLSPLYQKVWNGNNTAADKLSLKAAFKDSRRTFSVLYTSADDSVKRHLRPLHLEKKWSTSMKALSQRQGRLRVLICGPKASGKSTFSRYLLNHLLSPAPETENGYTNTDGVAFLDLDPGQPEFAPMGQVYLAHLRSPFFGPPFTHPSLDDSEDGQMVRAHLIGATSPKEDPDHYALAAMDLMDHYRSLLARYPQCPLIINYPGWIFGQGLEVATWLVRCLGLSDVVYMSEKGPSEVVDPLGLAAREARVPMTILPSQPTDFVSRSSAQLRSMQIQSYFHMSCPTGLSNPVWSNTPISRTRPIVVDYAGDRQGVLGIMVLGSQIHPDLLREVLEGSIVGVVAVESPHAVTGEEMDLDQTHGDSSLADSIVRTPREDLPHLLTGSGSCTPLDPKTSHCLGLALIRSIDTESHKIELSTPIPPSQLCESMEQGKNIVLVRGQLDNPNWAISEEYHAARAAERRYQQSVSRSSNENSLTETIDPQKEHNQTLALLRGRIRRASNVPWMTVVEGNSRRQREVTARREKSLWKLRKKAYPGSESETDWQ
ncbi:Pre-mRNA cleavage complex II Clp1 [Penicillium lagena]|uniref:Pre-mRNA cleavage complex II Clp1 n=1 Tax=Penicillium lagena TaxID=94218 RepID=UPI0025401ECA|nr:Pre-mRNA cleavage complex II Clp1 [Penicillium lagena]KAJ5601766.1 Pre-mRNA cleavage complex II Clp1 [Penicillium lagena]